MNEEKDQMIGRLQNHSIYNSCIVGKTKNKGVSFFKAWTIKNVIFVALSYSCIKLIDYGVLFWLNEYLSKEVGNKKVSKSKGSMTSIGYVGYMVGSIVLGQLSDYYNTRALFSMIIGINGFIYLFAYFYKGTSVMYWYILIIVSQTLLGGP
jgi:sugar phosphate permease